VRDEVKIDPAPKTVLRLSACGFGAELVHQSIGDQANRQRGAKRHDHQIVEVPDDRDELGNQIDWTEGVRGGRYCDDSRTPGDTRISSGDPDDERLLVSTGPSSPCYLFVAP
jgi:hypothetical protein